MLNDDPTIPPQPAETLAAIDAGTNSFHLIVVKMLGRQKFSVLAKEKVIVRLGESPSQIKILSEEAMQRGVEAMKIFKEIATRTDSPIRAVATSAVREATNREEFIDRVRTETGIELDVVSGFEEARLIYLGVLQALPVFNERIALFDIGGGSTEFIVGESGRMLYANSYKIGAIRMTQRFFPRERITSDEVEACRRYVLGEIYHTMARFRESGAPTLVASSGTAQTIASMALAARGEEIPESLNGVKVSRKEVADITKKVLAANSFKERATIPGVDPRRADILAAGCIVLKTILEDSGYDEYMISSYALREGLVLDSIRKAQGDREQIRHLSDLRHETVMKIGGMYSFDEAHGKHTAELALMIYDDLEELHRLPGSCRELLEAAALLHDIGFYISHSAHHKHSLYLIQNSETFGFTNDEIAIIANVARYHRKSHPKKAHPEFAVLDRADQQVVRQLAAILRIADALDRTHKAAIKSVRTTYSATTITLDVTCEEGCVPDFELWSVNRKKALMEEVFGREVQVMAPEEATTAISEKPLLG